MDNIKEYDPKRKKVQNDKHYPEKEKEGIKSDKKLNRKRGRERKRKRKKDINKDIEKKREKGKNKYNQKEEEKEKEKDNEVYDEDEPDLDVKEIKSYKINQEYFAVHGYMLEKDKSFLIQGFYYFLIYDSNTFEVLQEQKFKSRIKYISIIDNKRFLIALEQSYEYYELKNNKYECTKNIKIEKGGKRGELNSITLLKDQTKVACGEGKIISIRELETGKLTLTLTKHKGSLQVLFFIKMLSIKIFIWYHAAHISIYVFGI